MLLHFLRNHPPNRILHAVANHIMLKVGDASKTVIGTHCGCFHADELVACAMLKQMPEYRNAEIIRTRQMEKLAECSIVVDVGGLYDHATRRYDHHQREFDLTFRDFHPTAKLDIKLSSAGLIYVHYGHKVIACIIGAQEADPMVNLLFFKLYEWFISEIDAIDNGVQMTDTATRYNIHTGLSSRVKRLNPAWNKPDMDVDIAFMKALSMVEAEFVSRVRDCAEVWYPARALVAEAMRTRHSVDSSGALLILKDHGCPWSSHILDVEREELQSKGPFVEFNLDDHATVKGRPIYCLYKRKDGSWSAQAVPLSDSDAFKNRLPFPESWRGLRDQELSRVVGLPGCVFVHATGFLAVHETFEGALELAHRSLKLAHVMNHQANDTN